MTEINLRSKCVLGAYVYKNLESVELRTEFLEAIIKIAPEVLDDLQNNVYPIFLRVQKRVYEEGDHYSLTSYRWFDHEFYSKTHELLKDLKQPLDDWADRWNIGGRSFRHPDAFTTLPAELPNKLQVGQPVETVEGTYTWHMTSVSVLSSGAESQWVASLALHSMWLWSRNPEYFDEKHFSLPFEPYTPPLDKEQRSITFSTFEWRVEEESEADMKKRVMNALKKEIEAHTNRIKALMETRVGWQRPTNKQRKLQSHAEWLVRYQVQRWSQAQVAEHYSLGTNLDESTVSKAINKIAEKLLLNLRTPSVRGPAKNT